ncbi:hypothetical protein GW813_00990 [bacterium]|nr:hypothetical protein [bacterium]
MLPRSSLHGALTAVSLLLAPLTAHASAGGYSVGPVTAVVDSALTALVSSVGDLPTARGVELKPAYPNPFNPRTTIAWDIGPEVASASVQVEILDVRGHRVARLLDAVQAGGRTHTTQWNRLDDAGLAAPSGTYLAAVTVDSVQKSRFITLVK